MSSATDDYVLYGKQLPEPTLPEPTKIDYCKLPCPLPYEEISREAWTTLKLPTFEGLQVDATNLITQKFSLTNNAYMGSKDVSHPEFVFKTPTSRYSIGFNFEDSRKFLIGRYMATEGILTARGNWGLTDNLTAKVEGVFSNDPNYGREIMGGMDYKGKDWRSQINIGSNKIVIANYIQSVTPKLAVGSEVFWAGEQRISGFALAARYDTDKSVLTGKVSSGGTGEFSYVHKASDRVNLATDLTINAKSGDVVASVGYDYRLVHSRLRGKLESNWRSSAYLENRMSEGLTFLLSGEIDHKKVDYKIGVGVNLGQ